VIRFRLAALALSALAALVGCQARGPAAPTPLREAPGGITLKGRLAVKGGAYKLQTSFGDYRSDGNPSLLPYGPGDVALYIAHLYGRQDASLPFTPIASTAIDPGAAAFDLNNLKPDRYYRVVIEAYDVASRTINATETSKVDFDTLASSVTGIYENVDMDVTIPVTLLDQPFSGSLDVTRVIDDSYAGMRLELQEADAQGAASGDIIASADVVGTGVGQVTLENLDYNKRYLVTTHLKPPTGPLDPNTVATAVVDVDDYASKSETLATLTLPVTQAD
jgi:hypothetical protein